MAQGIQEWTKSNLWNTVTWSILEYLDLYLSSVFQLTQMWDGCDLSIELCSIVFTMDTNIVDVLCRKTFISC